MAADLARSKQTSKLAREIRTAIKEGGPDPRGNMRLGKLIEQSRAMNIPKTKIESIIAKGKDNSEKYLIEGRGPGGYSIIVHVFSCSRAKALLDISKILSKKNG